MVKSYKLTQIELTLSSKEQFEYNLNKFINNETIADYEKINFASKYPSTR